MSRIRGSLDRFLPVSPANAQELAAMARAAWRTHGLALIHPERLADAWERQKSEERAQRGETSLADGIPLASFQVDNLDAEYERLSGEGVTFTQPPMDAGEVKMAVFDDTCGNLIQIFQAD